jgi:hypothetical protein
MQYIRSSTSVYGNIQDAAFDFSEAELSPGVVLERRMVLGGGLGLLAGLFSPNWLGIFCQEPPADGSSAGTETIELETLIARLRPEAVRRCRTFWKNTFENSGAAKRLESRVQKVESRAG